MKETQKSDLKRALLARLIPEEPPLDLVTDFHWAVSGVTSPDAFFEILPALMCEGSIVYVEGTEIESRVSLFYEKHLHPKPITVAPDILFPKPQAFHLGFTPGLCDLFRKLLAIHQPAELFHHIKGYARGEVIFSFHDAFSGTLQISDEIPEGTIRHVCGKLNAKYASEATPRRDYAALTKLLNKLDGV